MKCSLHSDVLPTTTLLKLGSWKFHARIRREQYRQFSDECGHVALALLALLALPNCTEGITRNSIMLR